MRKILGEKGMTLVETMLVVAASTMIFYAMYVCMRTGSANLETAGLKMTIQESAREGVYKMSQELRESAPGRVALAADCSSVTFNIPSASAPITAGYQVDWAASQSIQYSVSGTQIVRRNLATGASTVMANDVTSVLFTTDTALPFTCSTSVSPNLVTIAINVQKNLMNNRAVPATPLQVAGQARIRNT
jgi:hypothetical protein